MLYPYNCVFLRHNPRFDYSARQFASSLVDLLVWIMNNELVLVQSLFVAVVRLDQSQV